MKKIIAFFQETYHRLTTPTASYYRTIQKILALDVMITGLPDLLLQYQAQWHVTFPSFVFTFANNSAAIAGIVGIIIAQLFVQNPNEIDVKTNGDVKPLLPFTNSITKSDS